MSKFAVLSDIHGNSWALKAVLDDLLARNIDLVVNLGDVLYGPLDPKGTFEILQTIETIGICGNQDRLLLENIDKKVDNQTMNFVFSQLDNAAIDYLKNLTFDHHHSSGVYFCHASPHKDDEYLIEKLFKTHVGIKENHEIDAVLENIDEKVVVCGHSHQPKVVKTGKKQIINPGSVGLPAYDDELPIFHKMETHCPDANYCILTLENNEVKNIDLVAVSYDFESAANMAQKNNRPDWAKWLRTGRG